MAPFRITAIFPELEDQHLPKEVVQLPDQLGQRLGAETTVLSIERGAKLELKEELAPGVRFEVLPDQGRLFFVEKGLLRYLYKQARSIDLLVLFHFHKRSYLLALLYKMLNPKGEVYLKGDVYNDRLAEGTATFSSRSHYRFLLGRLEKAAIRRMNLISVENQEALQIFRERYPKKMDDCIYLPSGVNADTVHQAVPHPLPMDERPFRILVVGRLGLYVKGHDILFRALETLDLKKFEIRFIGPELVDMEGQKERLFRKRPDLEERVRFMGPIRDRHRLFQEFGQGRFLCMPSRAESFGLVLLEAGALGVMPIGTDAIDSFDEITRNGRFGTKVPVEDPEALAKALQEHIDEPEEHHREAEAYRQHILEHFDWKGIAAKLQKELDQRSEGGSLSEGKR